ncbi:MAG: hypothetical protein ACM3IJ_00135 [Candidatus Levyibacteriota bacterium]
MTSGCCPLSLEEWFAGRAILESLSLWSAATLSTRSGGADGKGGGGTNPPYSTFSSSLFTPINVKIP